MDEHEDDEGDENTQTAIPGSKRCYNDRTILLLMGILTGTFAVAELVCGFATDSLSLVADAFHMIGDAFALIIAYRALIMALRAERLGDAYTFGWQRAEIVGAFANGVYLASVCFYNIFEAIPRLLQPQAMTNPYVVLGVGIGGLLVNLIGMLLFFSHRSLAKVAGVAHGHSHGHSHAHEETNDTVVQQHTGGNANMHGVFLHILGDLLGSILVIITAIVSIFVPDLAPYVDSVGGILISLIVLKSSIPLVRLASKVLMQTVPLHIDILDLEKQLRCITNVIYVHELHVWEMVPGYVVATVHLKIDNTSLEETQRIVCDANRVFCRHSVHRTTVQIEV